MSYPSDSTQSSIPRLSRFLLSAVCLLLGIASTAHYRQDLRLRALAERFGHEFSVDLRWPSDVKTMLLEPAGDLAADVVVHAALLDAQADVRWEDLSPGLRQAWVESMSRRDEELRAARNLMLDAITARPGWAYHRFLLGQVASAAAKRSGKSDLARRPELWAKPLRRAVSDAPGADAMWVALGEAYLDNWQELSPAMRSEASSVLRRAFLEPSFVSQGFLSAVAALGRSEAISLLPETSRLLDTAAQTLSRQGDIEGAALLMDRVGKAERKERAEDLRKIEERYRLGDVDGLRVACLTWISAYPASDFDDHLGRAQTARVLELWPGDRTGSWDKDARAELLRFFLNGRESDVKGETLARSLDPLSGVPEAVLARVKLLIGNIERAEELARGSEGADPLEWTSYFVELARFESKRGRPREALNALEHVVPGAGEECDVLQTRRDVARAMGDGAELEAVNQRLESLKMGSHSADVVSEFPEVSLSFCIDPVWAKGQVLTVEIEVAAPAVLVYGWDGGRSGTLYASESSSILRVPLAGLAGRRTFSVRASAGGPVSQLHATLAEPAK